MNIKIIVHTLLLCSFSFAYSMESIISSDMPITDENLQKIIGGLNKTLMMVDFVKKQADKNYVKLTSHTIKPFLSIDQKTLNTLFLDNIEDDQLRPLLLSLGADINAQTQYYNQNCLWLTKKPELLEHLIQQGAKVDMPDRFNTTRLHDLLSNTDHREIPANIKAACILLKAGANPNIGANLKNQPLETLLNSAIRKACTELVKLLLFNKANADAPNLRGEYPLHIAMPKPQTYDYFDHFHSVTMIPEIVILLLQHGANPNRLYPHTGNMPLHIAVLFGNPMIVNALLNHGAEKHHRDDFNRTAFDLAQPEHCYRQLGKEIVDSLMPDPTAVMTFSIADYKDTGNSRTNTSMTLSRSPEEQSGCMLQ